jgi:oligopeptide/dipeptide ABC transporter ATP-binding protein
MTAGGGPGALLDVGHLTVAVRRQNRQFRAVDDVSLSLARGASLGIVGESGSGKSITLRAIMGLLPRAATVRAGTVRIGGDLVTHGRGLGPADRRHRIAMVFQDALSALNPVMTAGDQIAEAPRRVLGMSARAARERALELLRVVGVPDPARRYRSYPHELSGGLRQRVMIAIALSSDPAILLCDEPTTALDVTIQAQILALLHDLRESTGLSIVFVTHDLAVVGQICDELSVMYAGRIVETGPVGAVLDNPRHPYTAALLAAAIDVDSAEREPLAIPGAVPDPLRPPPGCPFQPRCPLAQPDCAAGPVPLHDIGPGRATACLHDDELPPGAPAGPGHD